MGSTVRQKVSNNAWTDPATTIVLSFGSLPLAGSCVIVDFGYNGASGSSAISSVADNQGNIYTQRQTAFDAVASNVAVYSCDAIGTPSGTFTVTITLTSSSLTGQAAILEWTSPASPCFDKSGGFNSTSAGQTSSAVTASGANTGTVGAPQLVLDVIFDNGGAGSNVGMSDPATGYTTTVYIQQDVDTFGAGGSSYKIVTATETSAASRTWSTASNSIAAAVATFKGTGVVAGDNFYGQACL